MRAISLSESFSYRTVFVSMSHLSPDDATNIAALCENGYFFCHAVGNDGGAYVVRFGAVAPEDCDLVDFLVDTYDFSRPLAEFMLSLSEAGFDAVHFEAESDLVEGVAYYTPSGTRITPLEYNRPILSFDELTEEQKQYALENWVPDDAEDGEDYLNYSPDYFAVIEGKLYNISAECMRIYDGELSEMGFTGYFGESNTTAIYIRMSDDSESFDAVRVG